MERRIEDLFSLVSVMVAGNGKLGHFEATALPGIERLKVSMGGLTKDEALARLETKLEADIALLNNTLEAVRKYRRDVVEWDKELGGH